MNDKLHELLDLCLLIQKSGYGKNGHPRVSFQTRNFGGKVKIRIMDNGFGSSKGYDGNYNLDFDCKSEAYIECKHHLHDLIDKHNITIPVIAAHLDVDELSEADKAELEEFMKQLTKATVEKEG